MASFTDSIMPEDGTGAPSLGEWLLRTGTGAAESVIGGAIADRFPGSNPAPAHSSNVSDVLEARPVSIWTWLTPVLAAVVVAILLWRSLGIWWALAAAAAVGAGLYWFIG